MRRKEKTKMRLLDLPVEILCDIFKRLPVKSVCYLRCVSKTLLHIVQSPFFVSLHSCFSILRLSNAASDHQPPPLTLRFVGGDSSTDEIKALECLNYDSKDSLTVSENIMFTSNDARYSVYISYCNFFLFTINHEDCFLIDPFTTQVLMLPKSDILVTKYGTLDTDVYNEVYGVGFDSTTSTHKILRLSYIDGSKTNSYWGAVAQILDLGTNSWREIPQQTLNSISAPKYPLCSSASICAHGDMHWLTLVGAEIFIVSFDFKKEEFYRTPTSELPSLKLMGTNLITLRGSMAVVVVDTSWEKIDIWVMKDYYTKKWVRDYTIDVQESCRGFRFVCACCGEWENGIVFDNEVDAESLFVDLRCNSTKVMRHPSRSQGIWSNMLSFQRSLLSLKNYGNLDESRTTLFDFSNVC